MNNQIDNRLKHLAKKIKLLALDVDGVLTDGSVIYGNNGEELKTFNTLDGLGIRLLQQAGIEIAIITGRQSDMVQRRGSELGVTHILQKRNDKLNALEELCALLDISLDQTAYMGDDLPDLPAMKQASIGIAPNNAHADVASIALYRTTAIGGHGAVREACDMLLKARGSYDSIIEQYLYGEA